MSRLAAMVSCAKLPLGEAVMKQRQTQVSGWHLRHGICHASPAADPRTSSTSTVAVIHTGVQIQPRLRVRCGAFEWQTAATALRVARASASRAAEECGPVRSKSSDSS